MIVGQGQLDDILHAGPEARRALIEEAAGVLKHRKRKEKALRKLEAMQVNLTRLVDLAAELSRRLKPLGRQAEVARKAAVIQAELRDARLRLLADDYVTLAADLERDEADEAAVVARRAALEQELAQARARETELEEAAQQASARWPGPRRPGSRCPPWPSGCGPRRSSPRSGTPCSPSRPSPSAPGRDPDELDRQAAELREEETLTTRLEAGREVLAAAMAERTAAEAQLTAAERRQAEGARAAAARAGRVARLREQVGAADSRTAAAQEEMDRLAVSAEQARERAELAQASYEQVQELGGGREEDRSELAAAHEQAAPDPGRIVRTDRGLRTAERESARELAALRARAERWPKPRGAARTPPRRCLPTRPASPACSARLPPLQWPTATRWPSPRPWAPPPTPSP